MGRQWQCERDRLLLRKAGDYDFQPLNLFFYLKKWFYLRHSQILQRLLICFVLFISSYMFPILHESIPKGSVFSHLDFMYMYSPTIGFWFLFLVFKVAFHFYDFISPKSFCRSFFDILFIISITREEMAELFCFPMQ